MNDSKPERLLDEMQRHQLELYARATEDQLPWWYFPTLAVATAAMIATFDLESPWLTIAAVVLLVGVIGGSMRAVESRAGFSPRLSALPKPLRRRLYGYMLGHMAIVLAILAVAAFGSSHEWRFSIAGLASGAILWIGAALFQSRYQAHARDLAEQAGIDLG